MATANLPAPTLQPLSPVTDDKNLLTAVDDGASCCGGGCCSVD